MRKTFALLLAGTLAAPAGAAAQVCLGYPAGRGQVDAGAVVRLRSGLSQFGGTVAAHTPADVMLDAGLTFDHYSAGNENGFTAAGRAGLELHSDLLASTVSICPFAGAGFTHASGLTVLDVPIGFGVGAILPLEASTPADSAWALKLLLHTEPALFLAHASVPGHSQSSAVGGVELGARVLYQQYYAGAGLLVRAGHNDAVFSFYAGLTLPRHGP